MNTAAIMLIPDDTYIRARPKTKDHHLTVASYGSITSNMRKSQASMRDMVNRVARRFEGPIAVRSNGIGLFNAGNDGVAVVDLIDGIGTFRVRSAIESHNNDMFWPIDYTHGFTPHMTREFLAREDDFYAEIGADMIDDLEFKFVALGLWFGDERYEVEL